ncbi:MAG: acyl-CoA thioesterase, partial [Bacteriovorax sp.]
MKNQNESKTVRESAVETRYLVMPNHTNPQNSIFGGVVMSWIDMAAAMVAERHTNRPVVTVHVDGISFKAP